MAIPPKYLRIPADAPIPNGWELVPDVVATRRGKMIREKKAPGKPPMTDDEVNAALSGFGSMGISAQVVPADEISSMMGKMDLGKGGRKRSRKTRKARGRKRRTTRKH